MQTLKAALALRDSESRALALAFLAHSCPPGMGGNVSAAARDQPDGQGALCLQILRDNSPYPGEQEAHHRDFCRALGQVPHGQKASVLADLAVAAVKTREREVLREIAMSLPDNKGWISCNVSRSRIARGTLVNMRSSSPPPKFCGKGEDEIRAHFPIPRVLG